MSMLDTLAGRLPDKEALRRAAGAAGRRLSGFLGRRRGWRSWPLALLLPAAVVAVLAAITHISSILAMPTLAERNAYARLSEFTDSNEMVLLPDATPREAVLPMSDPAFVSAVCLFDLSDHGLKLRVPATADYTSVSFYTAEGLAFYALSDQAAGRVIELDLLTADQKAALPEDEEITAADRLVIVAPSTEGVVLVRAFVRERGMRAMVRRQLEAASCAENAP